MVNGKPAIIIISTENSKLVALLDDSGVFTVNAINPEEDFHTPDMEVYTLKKSNDFAGPQLPRDFVVSTNDVNNKDRVNKFVELLVKALWYNDGMGFAVNNDEIAYGTVTLSFERVSGTPVLFDMKLPVDENVRSYIMSFGGGGVLTMQGAPHPYTRMFVSIRPPYMMLGVICKYMVWCCDSYEVFADEFLNWR